ncbi:hypothetical protein SEA_MARKY_36 [Streptomyces phage Marky]|nr:hypothetical protein SEA_MARKY_36 [Streptomyces phage Marky]
MGFSAYGSPGGGSARTGYTLLARFRNNGRGIDAQFSADGMNEDDLQAIVDALAGIPGASYVVLFEGQVSERQLDPGRPYEPLPPPPQD